MTDEIVLDLMAAAVRRVLRPAQMPFPDEERCCLYVDFWSKRGVKVDRCSGSPAAVYQLHAAVRYHRSHPMDRAWRRAVEAGKE